MTDCACGSKKTYADCCGRFIDSDNVPVTPEELMRSRYTAYTKANIDYIAATMKSPASDHFDAADAKAWAESVEWGKLKVITSTTDSDTSTVEFEAHFFEDNKHYVLHEVSAFRRDDGRWYYIDGHIK
jgi:SEC-C motif-containing protein